uniref:CSON008058 protein n=1 Tax=Culicoides sonorensis TaxID=179676 RepID=A0A336LEV1_CULSO
MKILILFLSIRLVFGSDIVVSNIEKCAEMAKYYIETHNVTTAELAIIVSTCEGVKGPCGSGLGGGFQATIYNGNCNKTLYLNARERAPTQYDPNDTRAVAYIGVPSTLKGYEYLYKMNMCGTHPVLPWKDLFTKNIKFAEELSEATLAQTLRRIADEGPVSSLYKKDGYLHKKMVADLTEVNSHVKSSDILGYTVKTLKPFRHTCLSYKVATTRIPGSGSTFILGCKIVTAALPKLYNLSPEKRFLFMYHTLRYMYSLKPYLRSKHVDIGEIFDNSELIAKSILRKIDKPWTKKTITQFGNYTMRINPPRHRRKVGTANMVMKRGKYAISLTATINYGCGSGLKSPRLGFYYNNQLRDFDDSETPNRPAGQKNPQSAISATVLYSKRNNPVFQIGSAGGSYIIGSIFNTFYNYFVNNMTLVNANKAGRCLPLYNGHDETLRCESTVSENIKSIFKGFGFSESFNSKSGQVTACSTARKKPEAAFDHRRGGGIYIKN